MKKNVFFHDYHIKKNEKKYFFMLRDLSSWDYLKANNQPKTAWLVSISDFNFPYLQDHEKKIYKKQKTKKKKKKKKKKKLKKKKK